VFVFAAQSRKSRVTNFSVTGAICQKRGVLRCFSILRPYFTFTQTYISTSFHSTALLYIHPDLHLEFFPFYGLTLHSSRLTSQPLSILRPNFTFIQTYISNSFHSTALLYIHPDLHLNSFPFYALTLHSPTLTSRLLSILRPYFTFTQTYISTAFHSTALQLHSSRTSNTWVSTIHIIRSVYFQAECTERLLRALVGVCG